MKILFLAAGLAASASISCQTVFHDPAAQRRNVGPFTAVAVSGAVELQLTQGNEDAVAVSASNKDMLDRVHTEVKDNVLKISVEYNGWWKGNNGHVRAYVSARNLNLIRAAGASAVNINGEWKGTSLAIDMSGASDLKGMVTVSSLDVQLSGASDATLKGSAANLKVDASGASHLKGYDFTADNCLIDASGASDVNVTANKVINAHASGASDVYYRGAGQEGSVHSSGASTVARKG